MTNRGTPRVKKKVPTPRAMANGVEIVLFEWIWVMVMSLLQCCISKVLCNCNKYDYTMQR